MIAVYTFWTKPLCYRRKRRSEPVQSTPAFSIHHAAMWMLSVTLSKQWFKEVHLWTDDLGKQLLVDATGLKFDKVFTDIEEHFKSSTDAVINIWAAGKLFTYTQQTAPFIHIDHDVFLLSALPDRLTTAPVFAQSPEHFRVGWGSRECCYPFAPFLSFADNLPIEWLRAYNRKQHYAYNVGVFGGQDIETIRTYAKQSLDLIESPDNKRLVDCDSSVASVFFEQYPLGVKFEDRLPTLFDCSNPEIFSNDGRYIHLAGNFKKSPGGSFYAFKIANDTFPEQVSKLVLAKDQIEAVIK